MSRELFPHQLKSVELMLEAESRIEIQTDSLIKFRSTYGILTNSIGSGKTLTMMTLLNNHPLTIETCKTIIFGSSAIQVDIRDYVMKPESQNFTGGIFVPMCRYLPYQIVLCTKPLINEWISEADKSGIILRPISTETQAKNLATNRPAHHSIIVIHPELIHQTICGLLADEPYPMREGCVVFDRVVFDDIHMANKWKNSPYSILGLFTWFLSATPSVIDDKRTLTKHLRSTCSAFSAYGMISPAAHMVNVRVDTFMEPPVIEKSHPVSSHWAAECLSDVLTPEVKNMLNIGDYDGIKTHFKNILGEKVCKPIHELVLETEFVELERLKRNKERFIENDMSTDHVDEKIEKQQRKINGIKERIDVVSQEEAECPICMCDVERKEMSITPCCFNMFCSQCIAAECKTRKLCPTCRSPLKISQLLGITGTGEAVSIDHIAKMTRKKNGVNVSFTVYEAIEKIMSQDFKKKYIILTQSSDSVKTYKKYLEKTPEINLTTLSGRLSSMKRNIDNLREGISNGLFLNSNSTEAGLNLQFVDEIIIVGDFEESRLKQAIGRVKRYPRTEPIIVNYVTIHDHQ